MYESHIDHIWTNAPTQKCMLGIVKTYWIDHKPIYSNSNQLQQVVHSN
jgi:hypothetical protein